MSGPDLRQLIAQLIAGAVVMLGFLFLYLTRLEHDHDLETIVAGFMGVALQYVLGTAIAERSRMPG